MAEQAVQVRPRGAPVLGGGEHLFAAREEFPAGAVVRLMAEAVHLVRQNGAVKEKKVGAVQADIVQRAVFEAKRLYGRLRAVERRAAEAVMGVKSGHRFTGPCQFCGLQPSAVRVRFCAGLQFLYL